MDNKEIIKEYSKRLWDQRDLSVIDEYVIPTAKIHSPLNTVEGSCTMKEIAEKWLNAFPDLILKWEDFISDGNKVVSRWRATGTHMGSFFETAPTHHEIAYSGITIYTMENNKITEYWALVDMHAILSQLEGFETISEAIE